MCNCDILTTTIKTMGNDHYSFHMDGDDLSVSAIDRLFNMFYFRAFVSLIEFRELNTKTRFPFPHTFVLSIASTGQR